MAQRHPVPVESQVMETRERVVRLAAEEVSTEKRSAPVEEWQRKNWDYYDIHGEVHYPLTVGGNLASKVDVRVEELVDGNWQATTNPVALSALDDLYAADLEDFWRSVMINYSIAGQGYLLTSSPMGALEIEVCSSMEVYQETDLTWWRHDDRGEKEPIPRSTRVTKFWRPHPKYRLRPDSGLRSVQNECRELHLLKLALLAKIMSRLASVGILFIPNGISMPARNAEEGDLGGDPLVAMLNRLFQAPLASPGTTAAAMPIILRGPADDGEKIRHIILDTKLDAVEEQHRAELRQAIAQGIELPIETQTSMGDVNHINAWHIADSAMSDHVLPVCAGGTRLLTQRVLWPTMRMRDSSLSEQDVRRFRYVPDGSRATLGLNQTDPARQLYERGVLSPEALVRSHGFDPSDMPSAEQVVRWLGVKMNNPMMATWNLDVVIPEEILQAPAPPGVGGFDAPPPIADGSTLPGDPMKGLDQS